MNLNELSVGEISGFFRIIHARGQPLVLPLNVPAVVPVVLPLNVPAAVPLVPIVLPSLLHTWMQIGNGFPQLIKHLTNARIASLGVAFTNHKTLIAQNDVPLTWIQRLQEGASGMSLSPTDAQIANERIWSSGQMSNLYGTYFSYHNKLGDAQMSSFNKWNGLMNSFLAKFTAALKMGTSAATYWLTRREGLQARHSDPEFARRADLTVVAYQFNYLLVNAFKEEVLQMDVKIKSLFNQINGIHLLPSESGAALIIRIRGILEHFYGTPKSVSHTSPEYELEVFMRAVSAGITGTTDLKSQSLINLMKPILALPPDQLTILGIDGVLRKFREAEQDAGWSTKVHDTPKPILDEEALLERLHKKLFGSLKRENSGQSRESRGPTPAKKQRVEGNGNRNWKVQIEKQEASIAQRKAEVAKAQLDKVPVTKFEGECFHCKKIGHRKDWCNDFLRHLKSQVPGQHSTAVLAAQSVRAQKVSVVAGQRRPKNEKWKAKRAEKAVLAAQGVARTVGGHKAKKAAVDVELDEEYSDNQSDDE